MPRLTQKYTVNFLPNNLLNLLLGGLNTSKAPHELAINEFVKCENFRPTPQGYTNQNIGVTKINNNNLSSSKIQQVFKFKGFFYSVKNGQLYRLSGGTESLVSGLNFSTTNKISVKKAIGAGIEKVYFVDGFNNPKSFDGSSFAEITAFNASILGRSFSKPTNLFSVKERIIYIFSQNSSEKSFILATQEGNADNLTSVNNPVSTVDPFFAQVGSFDGEPVTAIGEIQRANQPEQATQIVVSKKRKCYLGSSFQTSSQAVLINFDLQASDIGCVNGESIVNFKNDLFVLNEYGVGAFTSAVASGGVDALTYSASVKINSFIQEASKNPGFEKAFCLHSPKEQEIIFFMPKDASTSLDSEDRLYPETPNNLAICFRYGIQLIDGQVINQFYTRSGNGFAFSTGIVADDGDFVLGDYFGNVWKLNSGNSYIPKDNATEEPIESVIKFGDWLLGSPDQYKQLKAISWSGTAFSKRFSDFEFELNQKGFNTVKVPNKESRSTGGQDIGTYGVSKYGEPLYGYNSQIKTEVKPAGATGYSISPTIRLKSSIETTVINTGNSFSEFPVGFYGTSKYGGSRYGGIGDPLDSTTKKYVENFGTINGIKGKYETGGVYN